MWDLLTNLPRRVKFTIIVLFDAAAIPILFWMACALQVGSVSGPAIPWWMFPISTALALPVFYYMGLYRAVVRYIGLDAMLLTIRAVTLATLLIVVTAFALGVTSLPPAVFVIFWGAMILGIGGARLVVRAMINRSSARRSASDRVIVYGAGDAGRQLLSALERSARYNPIAFVDDDPAVAGRDVAGYTVWPATELARLVNDYKISHVLIAIPTLTRQRRMEIIHDLEELPVKVMVMPGLSDLVSGQSLLTSLREVDVEDLLERDTVDPDELLLERTIRGKAVMVTGAGGSIGSELARQILRRAPSRLVLFEMSEYALYSIEQNLRAIKTAEKLDVMVVPVLGSVLNSDGVQRAMRECGVETVFHAAAYKHVPLVEANPIEGVRNNVFGTLNTLRAALEFGAERFVLVSTDKAVRPTNVMGASKRLAELVLQAHAAAGNHKTQLAMVRFGNVLASSGSVVPLFREQIRRGGPVTVTHPEVIRYFMTIPEATQLVMQAGAMGGEGEVFVLDMGQPVKIIDLAKRMVQLSGYTLKKPGSAHGDIEIKFTGLRPGEKLYEELLIADADQPTAHPRIRVAREQFLPLEELTAYLGQLRNAIELNDVGQIKTVLEATVDGYKPSDSFNSQSAAKADQPGIATISGRFTSARDLASR